MTDRASDFEAMPAFVDSYSEASFDGGWQERRLHLRAYAYWVSLLNGRALPAPSDLDLRSLPGVASHSLLLEFPTPAGNPILRYVGDALADESGLTAEGMLFDDVPGRSLLSRLTNRYEEIVRRRAPVSFEAEFLSLRGNPTLYRGILMPLSSDGRAIDVIHGVISWKELFDVGGSFWSSTPGGMRGMTRE